MAGIFGIPVFNDDIFNTGVAVAGKVGGSYDGWLGDRSEAVVVKPWKQRNLPEESPLELLIVTSPRMGQLFRKDLTGIPQLKQYADKLYDITLKAFTRQTFDEFKLNVQPLIIATNTMLMAAGSHYESPQMTAEPRVSQRFEKTLYGKKLHGVALMRMAVKLMEEDNDELSLESFTFDETASAWKGTTQYNDAAKILTFNHSSSFVGQVVYEKANKEMIIVLGDAIYNFCSVPRAIYDGFRKAGSKGSFFNRNIKGLWDC